MFKQKLFAVILALVASLGMTMTLASPAEAASKPTVSTTKPIIGNYFNVSVAAPYGGRTGYLQAYRAKKWVTIAKGKSNSKGVITFRTKANSSDKFYRGYFPKAKVKVGKKKKTVKAYYTNSVNVDPVVPTPVDPYPDPHELEAKPYMKGNFISGIPGTLTAPADKQMEGWTIYTISSVVTVYGENENVAVYYCPGATFTTDCDSNVINTTATPLGTENPLTLQFLDEKVTFKVVGANAHIKVRGDTVTYLPVN